MRTMLSLALMGTSVATVPMHNMNAGDYLIENPLPGRVKFNSTYASYADPSHPSPALQKVEYMSIYSPPIRTQYGQVWWTAMGNTPIPQHLQQRFAGKVMAVVGYEPDQVMSQGWNPNCLKGACDTPCDPVTGDCDQPGSPDTSVPITWAYNHHYVSHLVGANAEMESFTLKDRNDPRLQTSGRMAGHEKIGAKVRFARTKAGAPRATGAPTSQFFSEGNGGEYRKSYHGYPQGFAQLIESPHFWTIQPMQIDTWNRKYKDPRHKFVPGSDNVPPLPIPKEAKAPLTGPDAVYSGMLECPCTTRITKKLQTTYSAQSAGKCATAVTSAAECFTAAKTLGLKGAISTASGASASLPSGCSVTVQSTGKVSAFFNSKNGSAVPCGGSGPLHTAGAASSMVDVQLDLNSSPAGGLATITLTGPATVWFGVAFGTQLMKSLPGAIIVDGSGKVSEQKLGNHMAGTPISTQVKVKSSSVSGGKRTVVLTRAFKGATADHYTFDPKTMTTLQFINALGSGPKFAYHKSKTSSTMALTAVDAPSCVCNHPPPFGQTKGSIVYTDPLTNKSQSLGFSKSCAPEPRSTLLTQRNAICDIRPYPGGLDCCHHLWFLLDKDQDSSYTETIEYHMKFRFWFQDYDAQYHQNLVRLFVQTEQNAGEYDIPKCKAGTPASECVYTITSKWKIKDMIRPSLGSARDGALEQATVDKNLGINFMYASCHCHAPSCLSCELYNADTGALVCRQTPVFGGVNASTIANTHYDEPGYIAIPPCLFGKKEHGLAPSIFLSWNTTMLSIKKNNNTYGHPGEMAMWQNRFVVVNFTHPYGYPAAK